ncbi:MAG: putative quinol monooxygenase [Pseudomonadota bacterium]|nr:putative quinol monooxygenase [Pseudomonadota bacterium]
MNTPAKTFRKTFAAMALCAASTLSAAQSAPLVRFFELRIAPGQTQAFDAAGQANIVTSVRQEPGTLAMHAFTRQDDPLAAYVFEVYADQAAFRAHAASPHFKQFLATTQDILPGKKLIETEPRFLAEKPAALTVTGPAPLPQVRLAEITLHPERVADFSRIVQWEMARSMQHEPGVLAMYAATVKGQPHQWLFLEIYADEAAYQAHRATAHFRAYLDQTRDMIATRRVAVMQNSVLMSKGGLAFEQAQP